MKTRLQSIIDHYRLTPSRFADQIGVQRSAVSHILSGRNNPGLDFLAKILEQYTEVSGDWLITGKGEMLKKKSSKPVFTPTLFNSESSDLKDPEDQAIYRSVANSQLEASHAPIEEIIQPEFPQDSTKKIARIVIFYEDRSFESYQSE